MRVEAEAFEGVEDVRRGDAEGSGQGGCREDVGDHVRCRESPSRQVGDGRELEGRGRALFEEGPVHQDAVDDPEIARSRHAEVEADRTGALDHFGVFDHAAGGEVGLVVHAGHAGARVDPGLGVAVRVGAAVPFEMVVGEIEAHRRVGRERIGAGLEVEVPELVAGELDHERVEAAGVAHGIEHRGADVAHGSCAQTRRDQHLGGQARGGGLSVRAGDEHPVGRSPVGSDDLVAHAPRQLHVAPQGDALFLRPADQGVVRREARGGDDHLGCEGAQLGRDRVERPLVQAHAQDRQEAAVLGIRPFGHHEHLGAQLGEGVGDGETRHRQAQHGNAQALPVGVPAGEGGEVGHTRASHST